MSFQALPIEDPRDALEKARRKELERFMKERIPAEFAPGMPAPLMRRRLRAAGHTDIRIPRRILGQPSAVHTDATAVHLQGANGHGPAMDATDELERQWREQAAARPAPPRTVDDMNLAEMRHYAKTIGVQQGARETKVTLREKIRRHLDGQDAS